MMSKVCCVCVGTSRLGKVCVGAAKVVLGWYGGVIGTWARSGRGYRGACRGVWKRTGSSTNDTDISEEFLDFQINDRGIVLTIRVRQIHVCRCNSGLDIKVKCCIAVA